MARTRFGQYVDDGVNTEHVFPEMETGGTHRDSYHNLQFNPTTNKDIFYAVKVNLALTNLDDWINRFHAILMSQEIKHLSKELGWQAEYQYKSFTNAYSHLYNIWHLSHVNISFEYEKMCHTRLQFLYETQFKFKSSVKF